MNSSDKLHAFLVFIRLLPAYGHVYIMKTNLYLSSEEALETFRAFVQMYEDTSGSYFEELCKCLAIKNIPKGEILLSEGQVCDHIYFLANGFCFCYYIRDGKEFITDFFSRGEFCLLYHSFFARRNSLFTMKTSEYSTVLMLGYTDFVRLFRDFPEFRALMFRIAVHRFIRQESVEYVFRCFTAEERIVHFWKLHQLQEWIQHIPQYRIASWLNMTPETFAKIWGSLNRLR